MFLLLFYALRTRSIGFDYEKKPTIQLQKQMPSMLPLTQYPKQPHYDEYGQELTDYSLFVILNSKTNTKHAPILTVNTSSALHTDTTYTVSLAIDNKKELFGTCILTDWETFYPKEDKPTDTNFYQNLEYNSSANSPYNQHLIPSSGNAYVLNCYFHDMETEGYEMQYRAHVFLVKFTDLIII